MVMAGNENGAGPGPAASTDEALSSRLQWLQQRRQTLQEKLLLKNNELKNLCIDEAELTGILPPEIPLEPGESPPSFRRRVGTAYTYPQNLINKLKTTEALSKEESDLEVERQVQVRIAEAALGILNDPGESKAVRRKHRLVYQQSQRQLQELDARLSFIRQGHGKTSSVPRTLQPLNQNLRDHHRNLSNYATQPHPQTGHAAKHRSKKPRPPLEGERVSKSSRGLLQEGGVSLSPLSQEQNYNTYPGTGYHEVEPTQTPLASHYNQNRPAIIHHQSPTGRQQSPKLLVSNDLNDNHNVYILPDQYRGRTYSHGSGGGSRNNSSHYLDSERNYRPVPNTYTEQERLMRYRPHQLPTPQQQQLLLQNHQQYPDYKSGDNETARYNHPQYYPSEVSDQGSNLRRYAHTPDYQTSFKNPGQQNFQRRDQRLGSSNSGRINGPPTDPHQPPGYWMRYEDEIIWCPDNQDQGGGGDKFGSLDRRKRNNLQQVNSTGGNSGDAQIRYHTVAGSKSTSILPRHNIPLNPPLPLEEQNIAQTPSRILLRTQSLGSVETWNSVQSHDSGEKEKEGENLDALNSKVREKGWYETSLDSGPTTISRDSLMAQKKMQRNLISQGSYQKEVIASGGGVNEDQQHQKSRPQRYQPPKILEIPAESKILDNNNERGLESPKNCTVVQAGKYQPYREVTKPFEMSDFYKYSTKYRKRNAEGVGNSNPNVAHYNQAQSPVVGMGIGGSLNSVVSHNKLPQDPRVNMMIQMSRELRIENSNIEERSVPSPVQKRIYQPLQRMTCQPYNSLRAEEGGEEWYQSEKEAASSATLV